MDVKPHVHFASLLLVIAVASLGWARANNSGSQMLMEAIAGHVYARSTYLADGQLESRAQLRVGDTETEPDGGVTVTIDVESFTGLDEQGDVVRLRWSCNPTAASMLMNILILAGADLRRDLRLEVDTPPLRYPDSATVQTVFEDILLNIRIRRGVLSLLGTRTRLLVTNRRVKSANALGRGSYTIASDVKATVFVLGLPVRRRRFESLETVQGGVGLVRQSVVFSSGGYTVIEALAEGNDPANG